MLGSHGCVDSVVGAARVASANNDGAIPIPGDLEMLSWRVVVPDVQSHCLPLALIGLHQIIGTAEVLTLL